MKFEAEKKKIERAKAKLDADRKRIARSFLDYVEACIALDAKKNPNEYEIRDGQFGKIEIDGEAIFEMFYQHFENEELWQEIMDRMSDCKRLEVTGI